MSGKPTPLPAVSEHGGREPSAKPDWALTTRERRRAVLKAAGLESRPRKWLWFLIIAAGALAVGAVVLTGDEPLPEAAGVTVSTDQTAPTTMLIHPLDVTTIAPKTLQETLRVSGPLSPRRQVQLTAGVAGTLKAVNVRLGDRVRQGDVLVQIDIETLRAQLEQQRGTLAANRAQLALAESQLDRSTRLAERGIATAATLETDRRNLEVQRANLAAQEASVAAAEIAVRNATVVAPFDGIVASRDVEPGQIVANGANLIQIVDLATMSMAAVVPVSSSRLVASGQTVTFTIDGMSANSRFSGHVEGVSPTTSAGTRNTPISIVVENPEGDLRGGMFATGQIVLESAESALAVPTAAIREDQAGAFVLKIVEGRLERQAVAPGRTWQANSMVQVLDGLRAGDRIVSAPLKGLAPGAPVSVAEI